MGSIPITRSIVAPVEVESGGYKSVLKSDSKGAHVAQSVEHVLGKDEVSGSIPLVGSMSSRSE